MKTIFVVYTPLPLSKKEAFSLKRYSFNTKSKVKVGDYFISPDYSTPMQVVEVLSRSFKYVDFASGELSNTLTNTNQRPMKEIVVGKIYKNDKDKVNVCSIFDIPLIFGKF